MATSERDAAEVIVGTRTRTKGGAMRYLILALALTLPLSVEAYSPEDLVKVWALPQSCTGQLFSAATRKCMFCNLSRANLSGASLFGADLSRADLSDASLFGADLREADLSGANLFGADLTDANLAFASLEGANLKGALTKKTSMAGTILCNTIMPDGHVENRDCMVRE